MSEIQTYNGEMVRPAPVHQVAPPAQASNNTLFVQHNYYPGGAAASGTTAPATSPVSNGPSGLLGYARWVLLGGAAFCVLFVGHKLGQGNTAALQQQNQQLQQQLAQQQAAWQQMEACIQQVKP